MIKWLVENKDLLLFAQGIMVSMGIYHIAHRRPNGHHRQKAPLNAEDVFEELNGTSPLKHGEMSGRYVGARVKATGSIGRVKKLSDDLVAVSIIPKGAEGSVSTGISLSEFEKIGRASSGDDITLEGEISYMDFNSTHELFLSQAKLCLCA